MQTPLSDPIYKSEQYVKQWYKLHYISLYKIARNFTGFCIRVFYTLQEISVNLLMLYS